MMAAMIAATIVTAIATTIIWPRHAAGPVAIGSPLSWPHSAQLPS